MSNDAQKQLRSSEIHSKIEANLELARGLSKAATEIEEKLLGTTTPYSEGEDTKEPSGNFLAVVDRGLRTLHSELLHLKDILKSINAEF